MRLMGLVMVACLMMSAPAHAAWTGHKYPEFGFSVDFPAEVKTATGEWKTTVAHTVPTTILSAESDNITYQAIIADFAGRVGDTPTIAGEAAYVLSQEGMLIADTMCRTDPGPNAIYGRRVTVSLMDGSRKTTEVYASHGKLYMFATIISPKGDVGSSIAARFQDSIVFDFGPAPAR